MSEIVLSIKEIVTHLEQRVQFLISQFKIEHEKLNRLFVEDININVENDERSKDILNAMVNLFIELKPVERVVQHKHPELGGIFKQLARIEYERSNGYFVSFLSVMPGQTRYRGRKPKLLIQAPGQSEIK